MSLRKKIALLIFLPSLALLAISVVYGHVTEEALLAGEEAVSCVFKHNLRLYCPGCGGSRSLVYLLHFDIVRSFVYYPALPVALFFVIDVDARAAVAFIKNDPAPLHSFNTRLLLIIPILIFLNFILKNVALLAFGVDILGDVIK